MSFARVFVVCRAFERARVVHVFLAQGVLVNDNRPLLAF